MHAPRLFTRLELISHVLLHVFPDWNPIEQIRQYPWSLAHVHRYTWTSQSRVQLSPTQFIYPWKKMLFSVIYYWLTRTPAISKYIVSLSPNSGVTCISGSNFHKCKMSCKGYPLQPVKMNFSVHSSPVFLVSTFFSFSLELAVGLVFFLSSSSFSSSSSSLSDTPEELSTSFGFLPGLVTYESKKTEFCSQLNKINGDS